MITNAVVYKMTSKYMHHGTYMQLVVCSQGNHRSQQARTQHNPQIFTAQRVVPRSNLATAQRGRGGVRVVD